MALQQILDAPHGRRVPPTNATARTTGYPWCAAKPASTRRVSPSSRLPTNSARYLSSASQLCERHEQPASVGAATGLSFSPVLPLDQFEEEHDGPASDRFPWIRAAEAVHPRERLFDHDSALSGWVGVLASAAHARLIPES